MRTSDFDFVLPEHLIAQEPAPRREKSRLLAIDRATRSVHHLQFEEILTLLRPGDVLVRNDSRVIPARLRGTKTGSGGKFELLLCSENSSNDWWTLLRPGKRVHPGTRLMIHARDGSLSGIEAVVQEKNDEGHVRIQFNGCGNILDCLEGIGELPLPPYIRRPGSGPGKTDEDRYQTVYARHAGSLAAPTAGLHYTPELIAQLESKGVLIQNLTLHVGLGTFAPVKADNIQQHVMHSERYEIPEATARAVQDAIDSNRRVVAAGTTSARALEASARSNAGRVAPGRSSTSIFIHPPADFKIVGALQTNFHLPQSTLLMLVSAFAAPGRSDGREWMLSIYQAAIEQGYRFFSYGDSMFIG